ncbi:MAG TPA: hypothetical protein VGE93_12235, partial [Bryobacteraceae bacterium]
SPGARGRATGTLRPLPVNKTTEITNIDGCRMRLPQAVRHKQARKFIGSFVVTDEWWQREKTPWPIEGHFPKIGCLGKVEKLEFDV